MAFRARLFQWDGPAAWTFVAVPPDHAPTVFGPWGRAPVIATVNGVRWETSVWLDAKHGHGVLLAVPARVRGPLGDGDEVEVEIALR